MKANTQERDGNNNIANHCENNEKYNQKRKLD